MEVHWALGVLGKPISWRPPRRDLWSQTECQHFYDGRFL